jgi:hypothetical protein
VVLIALWTGLVRELAMDPYKGKETGETALFRKGNKGASNHYQEIAILFPDTFVP